jgi:hypothetical protein
MSPSVALAKTKAYLIIRNKKKQNKTIYETFK